MNKYKEACEKMKALEFYAIKIVDSILEEASEIEVESECIGKENDLRNRYPILSWLGGYSITDELPSLGGVVSKLQKFDVYIDLKYDSMLLEMEQELEYSIEELED